VPLESVKVKYRIGSSRFSHRDAQVCLRGRLIGAPFRLRRNSFMKKHVGGIVCYSSVPTGVTTHRGSCLIESVTWECTLNVQKNVQLNSVEHFENP